MDARRSVGRRIEIRASHRMRPAHVKHRRAILIVLTSLAAEGTPRLALELSRIWLSRGVRPVLVVLRSSPRDLTPEFNAIGIDPVVLGLPDRGYARYLILSAKIFSIARRHRATALLSMPLGWHAFMAIGARLAGVRRVVAHVGNYPNVGTGRAFAKFRALVQLGRPFTSKLVCCSRYVQEGTVSHFGVPRKETAVVYNGVPIDAFEARAARARSRCAKGEPFTIGMVARLEIHKDQATLIRAARILSERGSHVRVWLVGEGSQRSQLEELISAEKVSTSVELLGMRTDVPELVGQMDAFAFSTTPDEGLGIALIEAMAAGVPIVASDVGACREVLDDGKLGHLVRAADPVALADAIEAVRADPNAADLRAQQARTKAMRDFSMDDMARHYEAHLGLPAARLPLPSTTRPEFAS